MAMKSRGSDEHGALLLALLLALWGYMCLFQLRNIRRLHSEVRASIGSVKFVTLADFD